LLASYDINAQISAVEDLIAQQAPLQQVLRLLCLASITCGGIKTKVLENLNREILQTYGYGVLPVLLSLASLSLLLPNPLPKSHPAAPAAAGTAPPISSPSLKPPLTPQLFPPIRKALRVLSDTPESTPTDVSYVYSGYAPISLRLVQAVAMKGCVVANLAQGGGSSAGGGGEAGGKVEKVAAHPISGWKGFEDAVKLIPGAVVNEVQRGDTGEKQESTLPIVGSDAAPRAPGAPRATTTTMVFFLGGCTYTEIAAIRWMTRHNRGRRFLIATTGIINGSSFLEGLADGSAFKFPSRPLAVA